MKRISSSLIASALSPDPTRADPLHKQIYARVRERILSGHFAPGQEMPSTRALAKDLAVSRNTILGAFDQLRAEGYLEAATGSGTFVARSIPEHRFSHPARTVSIGRSAPPVHHRLSRLASGSVRKEGKILRATVYRPFQSGYPALDAFPHEAWGKLFAACQKKASAALLGYGHAAGYLPLRKAIASYLKLARGVRCEAEQVIIVSGAQQAFGLAADTLLDPGDSMLIEDPGYIGAQVAFQTASVRLHAAPVDDDGLNLSRASSGRMGARMIYTTPSHQYPMGSALSVARRMQLVKWAAESGAWILEDDYDGEFRYSSRPLPSLQGMDRVGCVIYVGTFSKVLFPGLRLGYMVVPPHVVDAFTIAKSIRDYHCPMLEQAVAAEFINEGHFGRHIRRMRVLYQERMEALLEAAEREMSGGWEIQKPDAGMHVVAQLNSDIDDKAVAAAAAQQGISTTPLSSCFIGASKKSGLLLGFAGYKSQQIKTSMQKLATIFNDRSKNRIDLNRRANKKTAS